MALKVQELLLDVDPASPPSHHDGNGDHTEKAASHQHQDKNKTTDVDEEMVKEMQSDLHVLLHEVEEERKITLALEKMVQSKDKEIAALERRVAKTEEKLARLKKKKKGSESEEDAEDVIERLQEKIGTLQRTQDQLVASLDGSADELDVMAKENRALCDTVETLKSTCASWEKQIQEHVRMESHLKDLLAEGSEWQVPLQDGKPVSVPRIAATHASKGSVSLEEYDALKKEYQQMLVHYKALEDNVAQWQNKSVSLQVTVFALCAELTRLSNAATGMRSCIVPILSDIESKLLQLL